MKKRLRLTPILIAIMMLFAMMPLISAPAHAEEIYKLWINGNHVMAGATSGDGWEFDASSNTLTLTDATITKGRSENNNYGIYYQGSKGLNIVLEGSNNIVSAQGGTPLTRGIYSTGGDITISGDGSLSIDVNADGIYAGQDVFIKGGSITASGATAIQAGRNVEIEGGTVTATSTSGNAIYATYLIELKGGSVTASGTGTGSGIYANGGINEIGKNMRIWAGDDESSASDVTDEFKTKFAQYKWVHASACTLWVGGIPVTGRNALDILGDLDEDATASYDYSTETLTLNNYSYESEGHVFGPDKKLYAAIYADQDLSIQLVGKNTVKCTEQEGSAGSGIYSAGKALTISGSGTLTATGYGQSGIGIQTHEKDIMINGGTVTASGHNGLSVTGGKIKVNGGIVTVIGNGDKGISSDEDSIVVADKMGINAGDSKETAIAVATEAFVKDHPQHWVQISEAYPLWVRGVWVMVTNKDDVLGDGKVSYDPNANTLKLNGATIAAGDKDSNGIKYSGNTPLNIESKSGSVNTVNGDNNCIYSSGDGQLIFLGGGTLDVTASGSNGCGIKSDAGIAIKEGSNLTVRGKAKAIDGALKNYITGTGWTDYDGMTKGQSIKAQIGSVNYKKVQFPEIVSGTPSAKMKAGKKSMTISWNKINGAEGYDIFFARCDHHGKNIVCKKVKNIKGNKTFKWTKSGLKNGTAYKAYVKAYIYKNGKKTYVKTSPVMHAYTGNGTKKYTNAKSVTLKNVKKGKVSLKKGKTYKIKAKVNKQQKGKRLMPKSHAPKLRYLTSDSSVATVSKKGKITAKGSGTCNIIAYAHNGVSKNIKVTVK